MKSPFPREALIAAAYRLEQANGNRIQLAEFDEISAAGTKCVRASGGWTSGPLQLRYHANLFRMSPTGLAKS